MHVAPKFSVIIRLKIEATFAYDSDRAVALSLAIVACRDELEQSTSETSYNGDSIVTSGLSSTSCPANSVVVRNVAESLQRCWYACHLSSVPAFMLTLPSSVALNVSFTPGHQCAMPKQNPSAPVIHQSAVAYTSSYSRLVAADLTLVPGYTGKMTRRSSPANSLSARFCFALAMKNGAYLPSVASLLDEAGVGRPGSIVYNYASRQRCLYFLSSLFTKGRSHCYLLAFHGADAFVRHDKF